MQKPGPGWTVNRTLWQESWNEGASPCPTSAGNMPVRGRNFFAALASLWVTAKTPQILILGSQTQFSERVSLEIQTPWAMKINCVGKANQHLFCLRCINRTAGSPNGWWGKDFLSNRVQLTNKEACRMSLLLTTTEAVDTGKKNQWLLKAFNEGWWLISLTAQEPTD